MAVACECPFSENSFRLRLAYLVVIIAACGKEKVHWQAVSAKQPKNDFD